VFEIGSSLREARIRQGIEFPALEQGTKIRAKYLRALEDERFELLPAHTYVKGFLRAYADELGLDGQLYVDEYNSRYVMADEEAPVRTHRVPAQRLRHQQRRESGVVVLALLAIGVVTALVIAAWKFGGPDQANVRGLEPSTSKAPAHTAAVKPRTRVTVWAADANTGLEVRRGSASGKVLYTGTLEQGQEQRFTSSGRIYLRVGNPAAVRVGVNGQRVALTPQWATYVVTPNGLTRISAGT